MSQQQRCWLGLFLCGLLSSSHGLLAESFDYQLQPQLIAHDTLLGDYKTAISNITAIVSGKWFRTPD